MAYNKKIEIQLLSETDDDIGQGVPTWNTLFSPWAEISTLKGREYYEAAQTNSEKDVIFKIRYSKQLADKLTSELRIVYNGLIYDINDINDVNEMHRNFEIRARRLNNYKLPAPPPTPEPAEEPVIDDPYDIGI